MIENFKTLLFHLEHRTGQYVVGNNSYYGIVNFIDGFNEASKSAEFNLLDSFNSWLKNKVSSNYSIHWAFFVLTEICNNDEVSAQNTLFRLFEEFLKTSNF